MATITGLFEAPASHEAPESPASGESDEAGYEAADETSFETYEDPFNTRVIPIPGMPGHAQGHELLTRAAARGLTGIPMGPLEFGVVVPDRGATYADFPREALRATDPALQPKHSLRVNARPSVRGDVADIRAHVRFLYLRAMKSPGSTAAWQAIGEALHTIQDSFSTAHTDRSGGAVPGGSPRIRYVRRYWGSPNPVSAAWRARTRAPGEHNYPTDPRDEIWASAGRLKPEAVAAVNASREFLVIAQRHFAAGTSNIADVNAFLNRHVTV